MDTFLKRIYVGEIKSQCQFALNAIGSLNHALKQVSGGIQVEQAQRMFFHSEVFRQIHSFLTHASNVSRLLWPPVPKQRETESDADYQARIQPQDKVQRAVSLRSLYGIDDGNGLKNRSLRDHLEHYDERLDDWRKTSVQRNIVSDMIGPKNSIVGIAPTDAMRWFDPSTNNFYFRGEEYNLQALASSVDVLLPQSVQLENELWEQQKRGA
jgi:hypothetical protein